MTRAALVLLSMTVVGRAWAEVPDAGTHDAEAATKQAPPDTPAAPQALTPIAPPPPVGSLWPDPAAPPPTPVPPPWPVPPPTPLGIEGPGDEEAKADFQHALRLPDGSPLYYAGGPGFIAFYGSGELDLIRDSTRSFDAAANNFGLARPQTVAGEDSSIQGTLCDSRLGLRVGTPEAARLGGVVLAELGPAYEPGDGVDYLCRARHVRHLYLGFRSPIVDVLLGKYYGLFGWGGKGFFPNTVAFLGVPGQLYYLESQLRVSHIFRWEPVDLELAAALAQSPQHLAGTGEATVGARFAVNGWRGAAAQGNGPPAASALQIGISLVRRVFEVNELAANPTRAFRVVGDGLAIDAFLPLIPARGADLDNSASLTLEVTWGSGLSDMYTGLTGGVSFPAPPNPGNSLMEPAYQPNIAPGIASFDASGRLHTVNWRTVLVGAQYHLPFERGRRVWVSCVVSGLSSDNALALVPSQGQAFVWADGWYYDLNAFVALLPPLQLAASYQVTHQTFGDGTEARNARAMVSLAYFF